MAFDDFRCVVLGNEPAGLWLLTQLEKLYREAGEEPRLAWVSLGQDPPAVSFPSALAASFDVAEGAPWSAQIHTPRHCFSWNAKTVADRFSALPAVDSTRPVLDSLSQLNASDGAAVRAALNRQPEIIGLAQGLWKGLGRTQRQTPELAAHYARYLTQLQWWSPERDLPSSVERLVLTPRLNTLESFKPRRPSGLSLQLRGFGEISSERWILNLDIRSLLTFAGPHSGFLDLLNLNWEPASLQALYPLRLRVESDAIPSPVSPLTLAFDTDLIPDPETEIWPMTLGAATQEHRELTLWAQAPGMVSLEAVLDRFRGGLKRVHALFPFLSRKLLHVSVPLGMDTCFPESDRREVADVLQDSSVEHYTQTGFYTETRSPAVSLLLPYLGCHLPYPIGSLLAARKILPSLSPKKKKNQPAARGLDGRPNAG